MRILREGRAEDGATGSFPNKYEVLSGSMKRIYSMFNEYPEVLLPLELLKSLAGVHLLFFTETEMERALHIFWPAKKKLEKYKAGKSSQEWQGKDPVLILQATGVPRLRLEHGFYHLNKVRSKSAASKVSEVIYMSSSCGLV